MRVNDSTVVVDFEPAVGAIYGLGSVDGDVGEVGLRLGRFDSLEDDDGISIDDVDASRGSERGGACDDVVNGLGEADGFGTLRNALDGVACPEKWCRTKPKECGGEE